MKPTINTSTLQSNAAPIENLQFQVSDMTVIMEALTKLYANPIKTLTQEYLCNARDSHREIKQTKPIEVTLPSKLNPVLIIRDFGCGLSEERVKKVFVYYGGSTKRGTNEQTGGFGIGAKSAWSYTDSFTIKSYLDGIEYVYLAHKANGVGQLNLLLKQPTSEANGVAIEIAVNPNDNNKFKNAVLQTICFWQEKETPTIKNMDGLVSKAKTNYKFDRLEVLDYFPECFDDGNFYYDNSLIVVDGVAYPNKFTDSLKQFIFKPFIIYVNTGEVNISPTRESLIDDEKNHEFFKTLQAKELLNINRFIAEQESKIASIKNGLIVITSLMTTFNKSLAYKNFTFEKTYNNKYLKIKIPTLGYEIKPYRSKTKSKISDTISSSMLENKQIYIDDTTDSKAKRVWRIKKLLKTNKELFFLDKNVDKTIADELQANSLAAVDCSDYTINRATRQAVVKQELCLHYYENSKVKTYQVNLKDINKPTIYALLESDTNSNKHQNTILNYIANTNTVVFISKATLNKIKNNKYFIPYNEFVSNYKPSDDEIKKYVANKLTCSFGSIMAISTRFASILDKLKDKTFTYLNEMNKIKSDSYILPEKLLPAKHKLIKEYEKNKTSIENLTTRYPLLDIVSTYNLQPAQLNDLVVYLNSK